MANIQRNEILYIFPIFLFLRIATSASFGNDERSESPFSLSLVFQVFARTQNSHAQTCPTAASTNQREGRGATEAASDVT